MEAYFSEHSWKSIMKEKLIIAVYVCPELYDTKSLI